MAETTDLFISLIKNCIVDTNDGDSDYQLLSEEQLKSILKLAKDHSLLPIIATELDKFSSNYSDGIKEELRNAQFSSLYSHEKLVYELESICDVFEKEKIPYIKLKGSRIKLFYPEPWMRTSGDLDILVREEDIPRAIDALVSQLNYRKDKDNYHDIPLYAPSGILLELHFSIKEHMDNMDKVLIQVWDNSYRSSTDSFEYLQSNEFFIFHQIAHMAYHFVSGGCGIRPFIDVYLLRKKLEFDDAKVREFCRQAELETFYDCVLKVIEVWFGDRESDELTDMLSEFIFDGGTFGNQMNQLAVKENQSGNHFRYICSRIFVPYDHLVVNYPNLKKHKWLMPFYEVKRWTTIMDSKIRKKSMNEIKTSGTMDSKYVQTVGKLLDELDLK